VGGLVLHADLPDSSYKPQDVLFKNPQPDIADRPQHLLELTICHETNMIKSRDYKLSKYSAIHDDCKADYRSHSIHLYTIELWSLGVVSDNASFTRKNTVVNIDGLPKFIMSQIVKCVNPSIFTAIEIWWVD